MSFILVLPLDIRIYNNIRIVYTPYIYIIYIKVYIYLYFPYVTAGSVDIIMYSLLSNNSFTFYY